MSRPELLARHPVEIIPDGGFYEYEEEPQLTWRWAAKKAGLILRNELDTPRSVEIRSMLETGAPGRLRVTTVRTEDQIEISGTRDYERTITLPAQGQVRLSFSCNCQRMKAPFDTRSLYFRLVNFRIVEPPASTDRAGNDQSYDITAHFN